MSRLRRRGLSRARRATGAGEEAVAPAEPSITGRLRAELEGLAYREARARTRAEAAERAREESEDKARRDLELARAEAAERVKAMEDELGAGTQGLRSELEGLAHREANAQARAETAERARRTPRKGPAATWSWLGPRRRSASRPRRLSSRSAPESSAPRWKGWWSARRRRGSEPRRRSASLRRHASRSTSSRKGCRAGSRSGWTRRPGDEPRPIRSESSGSRRPSSSAWLARRRGSANEPRSFAAKVDQGDRGARARA